MTTGGPGGTDAGTRPGADGEDVSGHLAGRPAVAPLRADGPLPRLARPATPTDGRVPTTTEVHAPARLLAGAGALLAVDVASAEGGVTGEVRALLDSGAEPGAEVARGPVGPGGRALLTVVLPRGEHVLRVSYAGSDDHAPSAATPRVLRVVAHPTLVTLRSNDPRVPEGDPVVLTARVTSGDGAPVPSGSVVFRAGERELGSAPVDHDGDALLATRALGVGLHRVVATYDGDEAHLGSRSAAMPQAVGVRLRPTALRLDVEEVDGDALVTLRLVDPGTGALHTRATGSVQLEGGQAGAVRAPLDEGVARVLVVGGAAHDLVARYGGDVEHLPSGTA